MISKSILVVLLLGAFSSYSQNRSIVGKWQDVHHAEQQVEITEQNQEYTGTKLKDPTKIIFRNLQWDDTSNTYKGMLISPENGKEMEVKIHMTSKDRFQFTVGAFVFKRTFEFKRI